MARSLWTGSISFGLVSVPVRMYSAIDEHKLHFNLLHEKDDSRIGYEKICKKEDKPVPDDEIVKAFEFAHAADPDAGEHLRAGDTITNLTGGNSVNSIASDGLIELRLTASNAAAYKELVAAVTKAAAEGAAAGYDDVGAGHLGGVDGHADSRCREQLHWLRRGKV